MERRPRGPARSAFALNLAVAAAAAVSANAQPAAAPLPAREWARATFESQRIAAAPWAALDSAIRGGTYGNIDHLLVVRHGYLLFDRAYGLDYRGIAAGKRSHIGCGPGACEGFRSAPDFNYFDPTTHPYRVGTPLHSLQSVTKSVIATVLGAAMHAGAIRGTDVPLLEALGPVAARHASDPARLARATLHDLLTMRTGIEWHETDRPLDGTNTTVQLEASDDWVRFTLGQPMDAEPRTKWAYNSGGSHLIGAVIRRATGRDPAEYAREALFTPLGITAFDWKRAGGGLPDGEGGLFLSAESLARIGLLYLRDGVWGERRILPTGFAREATGRLVVEGVGGGRGYGFQWWRLDRNGQEIWAGLGFGGQYLLVWPELDLIVVAFGWNIFGQRVPGVLGPILETVRASVAP